MAFNVGKIVTISKFCNPETPGIEAYNPRIELALKSCRISGLDSLDSPIAKSLLNAIKPRARSQYYRQNTIL
jgi:hypothetical protein